MKLSDVMSAMHVSVFAQVPLLIFFGIFVGVVLHLLQGKAAFEHARHLPLEGRQPEPEGEREP
ncbi:MAG TPA: cbb3-type cytochrome c oxidase subunit 3 [Polyangiaceae bacterium]|nr:cbb3-type cytochrome c oxidase subunit 3 [Polyangiaceae bacterium]